MSDQFNFSDYPYTNFNEVNLDYILETNKQIADQSQGEPGVGVPTGGTTGQVLTKASDTDYDTEWSDVDTSDVEYFDVTLTLAAGGAYYNSDKTPAQIVAAITAGQTVRAILSTDDETEYTFHLSYRPATFDGEYYTEDHVSFLLIDGRTISCEGSRTVWPFDSVVGQYDSQLSLYSTNAVENRVITQAIQNIQPSQEDIQDAVDAWLDDHASSIDGLSFEAKNALLALLRQVAYTVSNGEEYYAALENALIEGVVLESITATYTPTKTVYWWDDLSFITQFITVYANYSDGTSIQIPTAQCTITGVVTSGEQSFLIEYENQSTTVPVTIDDGMLYSLVDSDLIIVNASAIHLSDQTWKLDFDDGNKRRVFVLDRGVRPIVNNDTNADTIYYPVPIPSSATGVTVQITPDTRFIGVFLSNLVNGVYQYTDEVSSGWVQNSWTRSFSAGQYGYIYIGSKYNSAGSSYPTNPTNLTITFTS